MRPVDPTSALAALIAGNRRHLVRCHARNAEHEQQPLVAPGARPFALALAERSIVKVATSVFSATERDLHVVDCPIEAGARAEEHGIGLVVALHPLRTSLVEFAIEAEVEVERRISEDAAFERLAHALRASSHLREAILDGRVRAVAALLEEESQRVHWLGEHPRLAALLAAQPPG